MTRHPGRRGVVAGTLETLSVWREQRGIEREEPGSLATGATRARWQETAHPDRDWVLERGRGHPTLPPETADLAHARFGVCEASEVLP